MENWQKKEVIKQWREKTKTSEKAEFVEDEGTTYLALDGVYSKQELVELVYLWGVASQSRP